jgi:DNA-binding protein HU-beta
MTKKEFIDAVNKAAQQEGIDLTKKDTNELLNLVFEEAAKALEDGERFAFPDFGTFKLKYRKEREGVNPQNPDERITIPASYTVKFKPAPKMKERIND